MTENRFVEIVVTKIPHDNIFNIKVGRKLILDQSIALLYPNYEHAIEEKDFITLEMFVGFGYDYRIIGTYERLKDGASDGKA